MRLYNWLEFWEDQFRCRVRGSARTPYNAEYSRTCSGQERLTAENTNFEAQLQFVTDAVYAFVHAIKYGQHYNFLFYFCLRDVVNHVHKFNSDKLIYLLQVRNRRPLKFKINNYVDI